MVLKVTNPKSARSVPLAEIERRKEEKQAATHEVYFLYSCRRIKIGTSNHHHRRIMREIAPYCPAPLFLIGAISGGTVVEKRLHKRFSDDEIGWEWFHLSQELRSFLREDERRAERLEQAENRHRIWLRLELSTMESENEGPPSHPGGAANAIPFRTESLRSRESDVA